jgi:hypothetical protein
LPFAGESVKLELELTKGEVMPFVSDIVGPQRPLASWPALGPGTVRRTSTIDTHPAGPGRFRADLRARDASTDAGVEVVDDVVVRADLGGGLIDHIVGDDDRLRQLRGTRVGGGFRATITALLGADVERSTLLHLLLDDWVGASLVSGYGTLHAAITNGTEEPMGDVVADHLAGICSGFAPEASVVDFTRRNLLMPCARGPLAPPLAGDADDAMHAVEPLRAHGMRRMRRLDLNPHDTASAAFDAHFRDSHVDESGAETIVHEYAVAGRVDLATRTLAEVHAAARVLPWQECPGALGSAERVNGMAVGELRNRIRTEFVGTSTCTHLNDTLRSLGDLSALLDIHGLGHLASHR